MRSANLLPHLSPSEFDIEINQTMSIPKEQRATANYQDEERSQTDFVRNGELPVPKVCLVHHQFLYRLQ